MSNVANIADAAWKRKLQCKQDGSLDPTALVNFEMFLANQPKYAGRIRFNEFAMSIEMIEGATTREVNDSDTYRIRQYLQQNGMRPTEKEVVATVRAVAESNAYHPVRDYLAGLAWDYQPRLDCFLADYFGAERNNINGVFGRKFMISAIARIMQPGCRADNMLVLEGDQGIGKSGGVMALFGEQFSSSSPTLFHDHKRMVISMTGQWCIELAEFAAVKKSEIDQVKALISTPSDRVVLNYANFATQRKRQCVFMGTINPGQTGYLTDPTGNRRFWVVAATTVGWEAIKRDRDQLWAEAFIAYKNGDQWHLTPDEAGEAEALAKSRMRVDPWVQRLAARIEQEYLQAFTTQQAYELLNMGAGKDQDPFNARRLGECLRELGYVYGNNRVDGMVAKSWKLGS
jgi:predicted P-loop ATPase